MRPVNHAPAIAAWTCSMPVEAFSSPEITIIVMSLVK